MALFETLALPSIIIVPLTVSVFVAAFQESSPLEGGSQLVVWSFTRLTVWLVRCAVAVLAWAPRVTVHVVVPKPPVTVMYSSSTLTENELVGKPVAEATVSVVWEAVIAPPRVVLAPRPTRHVYELDGVRSKTVATLLSLVGKLP